MAALNWADIVEIPRAQAKQSLLGLLQDVGFAATSWQEGSIPLACVELGAQLWHEFSKVGVYLKTAYLNDKATGEALRRFSLSHYDNEKETAVSAQRRVTLTCSATEGPHNVNVGDLIIAAPDGATYRNVEGLSVVYPATIPTGGTKTLLFEAEQPGAASSLADGALLTTSGGQLVTTLAGVTITGDTVERVGLDEETDGRLRLRNATKWALLSNWELIADGALQLALKTSPSVASVALDDNNPRGAGTFDIYLAQLTETATPQMVADVQAAVDRRVLGNVLGLVKAAPEVALNPAGVVYHSPQFTSAAVQAGVEAALLAFVGTIPLGGFDFSPGPVRVVPINDIESVIRDALVDGQAARKTVVLTTPGADIDVPAYAKVTLGTPALTYVPTDS